jgi:hypothetical protein
MLIYMLLAILEVLIGAIVIVVRRQNRSVATTDMEKTQAPADCCGSHAVCERDSLLSSADDIVYFDDEELDVLANIPPEKMTAEQVKMIEDVFFTLREQDVAGWIRSVTLRGVTLPDSIRDQALLIIAERRFRTAQLYAEKHKNRD